MKRTGSVKWGKLQVGITLMVAVAVMMWASLTGVGTSIFDDKGEFHCYFDNVNGMLPGSPVWMSGVEVGNVKSVKFVNLNEKMKVMVVCRVKESVWAMLTEDSKVTIGTIGLLGDKYVEVIPGTKGLPAILYGDLIETVETGDAARMFAKGEKVFESAGGLMSSVEELVGKMNSGEGTIGQLATNDSLYVGLVSLVGSLTQLSSELHKNQERLTNSVEKMAGSVGELSDQVQSNRGTLGKLISDPVLYDNLANTSIKLDSIMQRINLAEGSLGLLVSDTGLYVEITNLAVRVGNLVTDMEENPKKYFKFSVF